jgi:hypothetical protein
MTSIDFILDRSGSMHTCYEDTLGGFNHFVEQQKKTNPDGSMSLTLFAHDYHIVYEDKSINDIVNLDEETYFPRGQTALLDAIGTTIKKSKNKTKHTVVILTDGEENASRVYTKGHINDLIEMKRQMGWEFVFLGANQDAIQTGHMLGIPENGAMTFDTNNIYNAFEGLSTAIDRQISGEESSICFNQLEREASQTL